MADVEVTPISAPTEPVAFALAESPLVGSVWEAVTVRLPAVMVWPAPPAWAVTLGETVVFASDTPTARAPALTPVALAPPPTTVSPLIVTALPALIVVPIK